MWHGVPQIQAPTAVHTKYQLAISYSFCRYSLDKNLVVNNTTARSKVKSKSHHDAAPPNQSPYQVSTTSTLWFQRYRPDKIFKLKATMTKSKVKSMAYHDVAHLHLHPPTPPPTMSQTSINFLHLMVSEVQSGQTMGENNTVTALEGYGVKTLNDFRTYNAQLAQDVHCSLYSLLCQNPNWLRIWDKYDMYIDNLWKYLNNL